MGKQTVETLVEGGKASAAPPLGPALGPLGVNIGQVVADINKKTGDFKGMKVPVKVIVDDETKEFEISIGTPPASALIKKEAGVQKGASNPKTDLVADLKLEQVIKIAKMKEDSLLGKSPVERVKEIVGTCNAMGIMVEGKKAQEVIEEISKGTHTQKIMSGKTELSAEELKELEEEKKKLQEELEAKKEQFTAKAKEIVAKMEGKPRNEIVKAMEEAELPQQIINEHAPAEEKKAEGGDKKEEAPKK